MQYSCDLFRRALDSLQAYPETDTDLLRDKKSSIAQITKILNSEIHKYKESTEMNRHSVVKVNKHLRQMIEEKETAECNKTCAVQQSYSSGAFKSLRQQREILEDKIVHFKLQIANAKSEIEGLEDFKAQQEAVISSKNAQIANLLQKSGTLRDEKHKLVVKQVNLSLLSQQQVKSQSFAKAGIKQYPSSSFQARISMDNPVSSENSTPSIWGSSCQSDV